jgi:hypothetical protein
MGRRSIVVADMATSGSATLSPMASFPCAQGRDQLRQRGRER